MTVQKILNLLEKNKDLFDLKEYEEVYEIVLKVSRSPKALHEYAVSLKDKGNEAYKEKKYTKAIDLYTEAINILPDNETFYSNRAAAYQNVDNLDEAIEDCLKAVELNSLYVKPCIRLSMLYKKKGDKANSEIYLKKVLELEPSNSYAYESLNSVKEEAERENRLNLEDPNMMEKIQEAMKSNPELIKQARDIFQKMPKEERDKMMSQDFSDYDD